MIIYKTQYKKKNELNPTVYEYTDVDLELGIPCEIILANIPNSDYEELSKLKIYPIKVRDYSNFIKYNTYLVFGKEHLQLQNGVSLLTGLIYANAHSKCGKINKLEDVLERIPYALEDVCRLLEMVANIKFEPRILSGDNFVFIGNKNGETIMIDSDNFEVIRDVVMKMNLLQEELIFKTEELRKWYLKALKAEQRNKKPTEFSDVILTVVEGMKYTFEYISEMSVFQLYALYIRILHVKNSDAITIYRTCSSKLPNINFGDGVIKDLYKKKNIKDVLMGESELQGKVGK